MIRSADHPPLWSPSPSPSPQPPLLPHLVASYYHHTQPPPPPHSPSTKQQPIDFSPPLIAMVVIAAAAFLMVTYSRLLSRHLLPPLLRQFRRYRQWRRRRHLLLLPSSSVLLDTLDSPPYVLDLYGLDDSVIKSMPLSVYSHDDFPGDGDGDCAVCLLEFVENDYVRTLPLCVHSFHVDCIDVWLRSHASCPLCRARVVLPPPPPPTQTQTQTLPLMSSSRIRPSFDDQGGLLLDSFFLDGPLPHSTRRSDSVATVPEILPDDPAVTVPRILKRSYSFGFERYPATSTSPWRSRDHHHHHRRGSLSFSFWRRPSPFTSLTKHRHQQRNRKSPLFAGRRRGVGGFAPLSESACIRYTYYQYSSSRGSKSMASPIFGRCSVSSRMRCGDPEALISPERYREATGAVD